METLGEMGRRISDDMRRDTKLRMEDEARSAKRVKIQQCKDSLPDLIRTTAEKGQRSVNVMQLSEGDLLFLANDDYPSGVQCPIMLEFVGWLTAQKLKYDITSYKCGYGAYQYFLQISW